MRRKNLDRFDRLVSEFEAIEQQEITLGSMGKRTYCPVISDDPQAAIDLFNEVIDEILSSHGKPREKIRHSLGLN